jgi:hypothetical protein
MLIQLKICSFGFNAVFFLVLAHCVLMKNVKCLFYPDIKIIAVTKSKELSCCRLKVLSLGEGEALWFKLKHVQLTCVHYKRILAAGRQSWP